MQFVSGGGRSFAKNLIASTMAKNRDVEEGASLNLDACKNVENRISVLMDAVFTNDNTSTSIGNHLDKFENGLKGDASECREENHPKYGEYAHKRKCTYLKIMLDEATKGSTRDIATRLMHSETGTGKGLPDKKKLEKIYTMYCQDFDAEIEQLKDCGGGAGDPIKVCSNYGVCCGNSGYLYHPGRQNICRSVKKYEIVNKTCQGVSGKYPLPDPPLGFISEVEAPTGKFMSALNNISNKPALGQANNESDAVHVWEGGAVVVSPAYNKPDAVQAYTNDGPKVTNEPVLGQANNESGGGAVVVSPAYNKPDAVQAYTNDGPKVTNEPVPGPPLMKRGRGPWGNK
jgi:hypothetical protein